MFFIIIMMSTFWYQVIVWFKCSFAYWIASVDIYVQYNDEKSADRNEQAINKMTRYQAPGLSTLKTFQNYFTEQFIECSLLALLYHRVAP